MKGTKPVEEQALSSSASHYGVAELTKRAVLEATRRRGRPSPKRHAHPNGAMEGLLMLRLRLS